MTTAPDSTTACWTLTADVDAEWIPHYATEADAHRALADQLNDLFDDDRESFEATDPDVHQRADVCVRLVCDGCGLASGTDGEMVDAEDGDHFDPVELDGWILDALDWTVDSTTGHDYCPTCPRVPDPVAVEDLAREPGPNDVPLDGMPG